MKGILKKNDKWVIEYQEIASYEPQRCDFPDYETKQLSLHPDDVKEIIGWQNLYRKPFPFTEKEIEFEIVKIPEITCKQAKCLGGDIYFCQKSYQVAKLITKQEESSNWDDIAVRSRCNNMDRFLTYLKEHYLPPVKR